MEPTLCEECGKVIPEEDIVESFIPSERGILYYECLNCGYELEVC